MAIAYRCAGYGSFGDTPNTPFAGSCDTVLDHSNPYSGSVRTNYVDGSMLGLYIIIEFYDDVTNNPIEVSGNAIMDVTDSGVSCGYQLGVRQLVSVGWGFPRGTEFAESDIIEETAQQEIWHEDDVYIPIDVPAFSGASKYAFFLRGESRGGVQDPEWEVLLRTAPFIDAISFSDLAPMAQPPVASFTATPTSGVAPLVVTFEDTSTAEPTTWYWDFGDGDTSTEQNPLHTYTIAGTYIVTLTVSNTAGEDTASQANAITVYEPTITVRLVVLSASEKFMTGRMVRVTNPVVTCPMTDIIVEEDGVILLTIPGEFELGTAIPVRVRAPGYVEVSRMIPYAGDSVESVVWLWDISQYSR